MFRWILTAISIPVLSMATDPAATTEFSPTLTPPMMVAPAARAPFSMTP
ncbi:hypothetical protein [Phenylobacterium sp. Root700]|nr:hypothetical protein [Phenylobacterium sp. Root700]